MQYKIKQPFLREHTVKHLFAISQHMMARSLRAKPFMVDHITTLHCMYDINTVHTEQSITTHPDSNTKYTRCFPGASNDLYQSKCYWENHQNLEKPSLVKRKQCTTDLTAHQIRWIACSAARFSLKLPIKSEINQMALWLRGCVLLW